MRSPRRPHPVRHRFPSRAPHRYRHRGQHLCPVLTHPRWNRTSVTSTMPPQNSIRCLSITRCGKRRMPCVLPNGKPRRNTQSSADRPILRSVRHLIIPLCTPRHAEIAAVLVRCSTMLFRQHLPKIVQTFSRRNRRWHPRSRARLRRCAVRVSIKKQMPCSP